MPDPQIGLILLVTSLLFIVLAYLLGATPTGYWLCLGLKGIDIREHGSKSTGATNVLRVVGKLPALVVFLVDVGKGSLAVLLTGWLYVLLTSKLLNGLSWDDAVTSLAITDATTWLPWLVVLSGLMALLGHSKSFWINFTGGKSVATGLGVLLALDWRVGLATFALFGLVLGASRIVSLSSITAAFGVTALMWWLNPLWAYRLFAIAGGLYVIYRHNSNIQRLLAGTEPRLGETVDS